MFVKKNLINFCLLVSALFAFSPTVFAAGGAMMCRDLFPKKEQVQNSRTVERRNGDSPFTFVPAPKIAQQTMESPLLPERTRLIMSYEQHTYYEKRMAYEKHRLRMYQETIVIAEGQLRNFREEIPMDPNLPFVINANLEKGRRLYDRTLEKGRGIVLFIDVNDLGWINKNFGDGSIAGDHFVLAVSKAIQEITSQKGLAFRLGGDEFGILLPIMKPAELNQLLKLVQAKTKEYAEKIFRAEQDRRWKAYTTANALRDEVKKSPEGFSADRIDEIEAQFIAAREEMKIFLHYSQPNIAIGATYYGGRSAEVVQHEVEQNAHPHKMAVKKSNHASISKYVTNPDEIYYIKGPLFVIDYEFPLLPDQTHIAAPTRAKIDFDKPQIKWARQRIIHHHIGQYNIAEYKSDHGVYQLKVETWKNGVIQDLTDLPLHKHTRLIDAGSPIAQDLIPELKASSNYNGIWINLLNLGKMNYFKDKSKTGDMALARIAKIMNDFFNNETALAGKNRIGFKLRGSEFLYFVEGISPRELETHLQMLINSDPVIKKIYEDQINFLISQSTSGSDNSAKIEEIRAMMNGPFVEIRSP